MNFILQMAIRETRSSWKRFLFFFLCIGIGVGSIVAVRSVIRNFHTVMSDDVKAILGADISISSSRPWRAETLAAIQKIAGPFVKAKAETIESATMLRTVGESNQNAILVEIKGIEPPFPFYGTYTLANGLPFQHSLLSNNGIVVDRTVLERMNIQIGANVKIGESTFQIRGIIDREPGAATGFRFGPRVVILRQSLEKAGLTGFGSRARRRILLKVDEYKVEPLTKALKTKLNQQFVSVRSYRESQENINERYTQAENFLSLTGLIILVLGGIGVSSVTRVFIDQKRKTIAILKCVGSTGKRITSVYMTQILTLGLLGSVMGIALAKMILILLAKYYSSQLPPVMSYDLRWYAIVQGLGFGFLVTLLFSILPLLRIRWIKPNVLLREVEVESTRSKGSFWSRFDFLRWSVAFFVGTGMLLLASWQAGSLKIGAFFLGGFVATGLILRAASWILIRIVQRSRKIAAFPLRHAISSLHRPGNQTHVIIMAVGLGAFFLVATSSVQSNLLREMDFEQRTNLPNMYLIDIQPDQKNGVEKLIRTSGARNVTILPTVRARIAAINGKKVDPQSEEYKKDRRLGFEYTVTYRQTLDENESVSQGTFWKPAPSPKPEVSIEESMEGMMGLKLGGTITFDILGRKIDARVTSIRRVDWKNSRTGFYVVFRPGVLENAPNVYVSALDAPLKEPDRSRFQKTLVDQYPNVTAIDVVDVVNEVKKILNTITIAISFIGAFVFVSGIFILIGSIAMTKFQRIYEAAVLKTLGAKRKLVLSLFLIEYGLLGAVSGLIASLAGAGLAYAITVHVFEIHWQWTSKIYVTGMLGTIALIALIGSLSSLDVLQKKPLAVLRSN